MRWRIDRGISRIICFHAAVSERLHAAVERKDFARKIIGRMQTDSITYRWRQGKWGVM